MDFENVVKGTNINKKYRGFELNIDELVIPKGFATALIGENGAGKTTLLDLMSGIRLDYKGEFSYFDEGLSIMDETVKNRIGYTASNSFFLPGWNISQVEEITDLLFDGFDKQCFRDFVEELQIPNEKKRTIKTLSDGNVMKLMLSTVLARDTDLLILDEPASPLDPLMRDKLCDLFRRYLGEKDGQRSILFSTHNVADMESVTDYVLLMQHGKLIERGFVEELKEKYVLISGDENFDTVCKYLIGGNATQVGYTGLCLTCNLEKFAGIPVSVETPNLSQICINILKQNSTLK